MGIPGGIFQAEVGASAKALGLKQQVRYIGEQPESQCD